jgi:hypothetical protein
MIIAVDFDGTCVTHEYPKIGKDIGAVPVLQKLFGTIEHPTIHKLILYTMRSGKELDEAVDWFLSNNIPIWSVNNPQQKNWTQSLKIYANIYIDDAALGCPLRLDPDISDRAFVNW